MAQFVLTADETLALVTKQAEAVFGLSERDLGKSLRELEQANRQLETAYDELQSTNDELQTINDTLRERSLELDELNDFLESIMVSMRAGIVVVDKEMVVKGWNRGAEELWGVRRDEAEGGHLLNLDIGLPVSDLRPMIRGAISEADYDATVMLDAVNRRGRGAVIRLRCVSLRGSDGDSRGALLMMEDVSADPS